MKKKEDIVREEIEQKVLLYDLETSFNKAYCFGKYEQDILVYDEESRLLSFAYKWLGTKDIFCFAEPDFKSNKRLVQELWKLIDEADIIVAHNAKRFDNRKSNSFFLEHNLPPPSPYRVFDTREFAKYKFSFNSNALEDLAEHLGFGKKTTISDKQRLWVRLTDKKASKEDWALLKKYNKRDVSLLEKVYLLMKPYTANHPAVYISDRGVCPVCGSQRLELRGWDHQASGLKKRKYVCKDCGKWMTSTWSVRFADKDNLIK